MYRLIFLLFLLGCERASPPPASKATPIPVQIAAPLVKDIPAHLETIGLLRPSSLVEIQPQVEGVLKAIYVKEGEWVKAGTPLFQIDPQAHLLKMKEIEAQIAIDQAVLAAAEKKLKRYHQLVEKNLVAESEWDRHQMEVAKTSGALDLDLARLEMVALDLSRCTLESPIDGWMSKIDASPGQLIAHKHKGPLGTVLQLDPLIVEFSLTEREFERLEGQEKRMEIHRLCGDEKTCRGSITFVDSHFDPKTGQILVRGKLANPDLALRPGQLVSIKIPVAIEKGALLVPEKAIKHSSYGPYVYVIGEDKTAHIRSVILGDPVENEVIIREGLNPQEQVITEGHLRIYPGIKVEIKS